MVLRTKLCTSVGGMVWYHTILRNIMHCNIILCPCHVSIIQPLVSWFRSMYVRYGRATAAFVPEVIATTLETSCFIYGIFCPRAEDDGPCLTEGENFSPRSGNVYGVRSRAKKGSLVVEARHRSSGLDQTLPWWWLPYSLPRLAQHLTW